MLDVLRASKGGIITWIFLAAIILTFVISFGPGSFARGNHGCGGTSLAYAVRVNGETVPAVVVQRQFEQMSSMYRAQYGDELVKLLAPQVAQQAMEAVVSRTLVVQEAQRRGLRVGQGEVDDQIRANPDFQENGRYSKEAFEREAPRVAGSTQQYMDLVRTDLLNQRLQAAFEDSINVPESEVHDTWKKVSDRVALTYVLFPTVDARAEVKVSDADAQAFATKEAARVAKFYEDNPTRFDQPRKVRARHILARVQGKDDAAAKKKIETALGRLKKGEDFAKVAAELSEDENTKKSGGDLGVVTEGAVDPAFAQAAMALEAGKLSDPVRTAAGWEVIKADEVVPAKKVSLEAARLDIGRELLASDRAAQLQKDKAEAALQAARAGKALTDLFPEPQKAQPAQDGKPAVPEKIASLTFGGKPVVARETGPFPASSTSVPQLNATGDLLKDAVAAQQGAVLPRVYDTPAGLVVAAVTQRQRPDESAYPKEREGMEMQLRMSKAQQLRQSWVADLRSRAKVDENTTLVRLLAGQDVGGLPQPAPDDY
jgi:peptidyl-prolyl cis-trans isomerase D